MFYEGRVYRPPSEARSLIVQATIGCPHNDCTFCSMYKGEKFKIKSFEQVYDNLVEAHGMYPWIEKIFLADGDSLIIKTPQLLKIIDSCYDLYRDLKQVNIYATTNSILRKSLDELKELKKHGLEIVYLGVESGSAEVLRRIKKGVTPEQIIEAGKRVREAGLKLSVTFISGIGSHELSKEHAIETARVINEMKPDYIGILTLLLEERAPLYKDVKEGRFTILEPHEILEETKLMVENINVENGIFRMNHASNYISLRGTFPQDKDKILQDIERGLKISDKNHKNKFRAL